MSWEMRDKSMCLALFGSKLSTLSLAKYLEKSKTRIILGHTHMVMGDLTTAGSQGPQHSTNIPYLFLGWFIPTSSCLQPSECHHTPLGGIWNHAHKKEVCILLLLLLLLLLVLLLLLLLNDNVYYHCDEGIPVIACYIVVNYQLLLLAWNHQPWICSSRWCLRQCPPDGVHSPRGLCELVGAEPWSGSWGLGRILGSIKKGAKIEKKKWDTWKCANITGSKTCWKHFSLTFWGCCIEEDLFDYHHNIG